MSNDDEVDEAARRWSEALGALSSEDRERVNALLRERLRAADPAGRWRCLLGAARDLIERSAPLPAELATRHVDPRAYLSLVLAVAGLDGEEDTRRRAALILPEAG